MLMVMPLWSRAFVVVSHSFPCGILLEMRSTNFYVEETIPSRLRRIQTSCVAVRFKYRSNEGGENYNNWQSLNSIYSTLLLTVVFMSAVHQTSCYMVQNLERRWHPICHFRKSSIEGQVAKRKLTMAGYDWYSVSYVYANEEEEEELQNFRVVAAWSRTSQDLRFHWRIYCWRP